MSISPRSTQDTTARRVERLIENRKKLSREYVTRGAGRKAPIGIHRAVSRFASYWPLAVASAARDAFTHTCNHLVTYCTQRGNEGICMMERTLARNLISGINFAVRTSVRSIFFYSQIWPLKFATWSTWEPNGCTKLWRKLCQACSLLILLLAINRNC